ncbi:MAG: BlaI/MecI/CopY family transcriptional regulator, partial [Psychrosphaera sp.]|nr:BlaI/MecI/CopY family transcriptional regulator [Psychrosphaera sp.]
LTETEQRIMEVLWRDGEASVRAIADELSKTKPTAYTSAQTMCKILADKGYATFRKEGRAFMYSAIISQNNARQSALKSLVNRFFGGSSEVLTQYLMEQSDVDVNELQSLQDKIDAKEKSSKSQSE